MHRPSTVQLAGGSVCCLGVVQAVGRGAEDVAGERSGGRLHEARVTAQQSHWPAYWQLAVSFRLARVANTCCKFLAPFVHVKYNHFEIKCVQST